MSLAAPLNDAPYIDRAFVLEKCSNFVDFQIWPLKSVLDPEAWLGNFYDDEKEHALHLLNAFLFYSEGMTDQLFLSGFHSLSSEIRPPTSGHIEASASWNTFLSRLILTYVEGEIPNPTDSGFLYTRKARQILGIDEQQICAPRDALSAVMADPTRPVVFVDDFVGSGNQFVDTWKRAYPLQQGAQSFKAFATANATAMFYYTPAIATAFGMSTILAEAPKVVVSPGNILPPENSALHSKSNVWPQKLLASGPQFVQAASHRAGIPDKMGGVGDWRGFNKLGLCLAFSHSTPDATLPLFYWEKNGWHPLVRRR